MGGFITAAARLVRQNVRPLVLPAAGQSPSIFKHLYDLSGVVTSIIILNYVASPFILLSAKDSVHTWGVLGWYGHIIIMGGLVFFYSGGTKFFRGLQKRAGILPASKGAATNGKSAVDSGMNTPASEKNFVLPPAVDKIVPPMQ